MGVLRVQGHKGGHVAATAVCSTSIVACVTNVPALGESHSAQLQRARVTAQGRAEPTKGSFWHLTEPSGLFKILASGIER